MGLTSKREEVRPYLNLTLLRMGDVVLCREKTLRSRMVPAATGGEFSHAAFVHKPMMWFESIPSGIGYYIKKPTFGRYQNGNTELLMDVSNFARFGVFRHPMLEPPLSKAIKERLEKLPGILKGLHGRDYANFEDLLQLPRTPLAKTIVQIFPTLVKFATRVVDTRFKFVPGPFCSALIAVLLTDLGADPFNQPRDPMSTAPSDFADGTSCYLHEVDVIEELNQAATDRLWAYGSADHIASEKLKTFLARGEAINRRTWAQSAMNRLQTPSVPFDKSEMTVMLEKRRALCRKLEELYLSVSNGLKDAVQKHEAGQIEKGLLIWVCMHARNNLRPTRLAGFHLYELKTALRKVQTENIATKLRWNEAEVHAMRDGLIEMVQDIEALERTRNRLQSEASNLLQKLRNSE